jgi:sulfate transport system permease protein
LHGRSKTAAAGARLVRPATTEPTWMRWSMIGLSLLFLAHFLLLPLAAVFVEALRKGIGAYLDSFDDEAAVAAITLTLLVAAIAVPANLVFGLAASWAIAKFEFFG